MNGHERARQLSALAIDFPLSPTERRELDEHLSSCGPCQTFKAGIRIDAASLRSIAQHPAPVALRQAVAAAALAGGPDRRLTLALQMAWVLVLAGLAVLALTGALILVGGHTPPIIPNQATGLRVAATIHASSGIIPGQQPPGPHPGGGAEGITGAAYGEGSVWVTSADGIQRIDPTTNTLLATVSLGAHPTRIAFGAGSMWVTITGDGMLARIDPATTAVLARIPVGRQPVGVAFGDDSVWVASWLDQSLVRVDPATNRISATIPLATSPFNVAATSGAIWVTGISGSGFLAQSSLLQIDPITNTVVVTASTPSAGELAAEGDTVWFLADNSVSRVNGTSPPIPVHNGASGLALGGGSLWVFSSQGFVERIDPATNAIADEVTFPVPSDGVWGVSGTYGAGAAWARSYDANAVFRIDPGR